MKFEGLVDRIMIKNLLPQTVSIKYLEQIRKTQ